MIRALGHHEPQLTVEYTPPPTDPGELAKIRDRQVRGKRNTDYWNAHASTFFEQFRGKCVCISGAEHFVADGAREAEALGAAAHPEDDARFVMYIPKQKMLRV